tara:strand:- start:309 stop:578 length:270 start_codon:yes stop_codon:yes gene_type:complete
MAPSLKQIDAKIEELETILPQLEKASEERHITSDTGWWITMAGNTGGTALAVTAGNQAHEVDQLISQVERKLVLLRASRIGRQSQSASN